MRDTTRHVNIRIGRERSVVARARLWGIAAVAALAVGATSIPILARAASAAPSAKGTVIATSITPFGRALVVGSGPFAGYSLYTITSDHGTTFGCPSTKVKSPIGPTLCTGPSNDRNAEWPAITTTGAPIAGPGVSKKLLGMVKRTFGEQVTYAGHPLYLFDSMPGAVTGQSWDEPSLPPWHGIWTLIAPSGRALPWVGTLTTMKIGKRTVLATQMNTGIGTINFPVYSYSKDTAAHSACTGLCAIAWPPMLTSGTPGVTKGLSPGAVGTLSRPGGIQVRYHGKPLYLFGFEGLALTATGIGATGNGNGIVVNGGTFKLINA
jgi:predicted lipoprotein with Yx(FWY)xxD motif